MKTFNRICILPGVYYSCLPANLNSSAPVPPPTVATSGLTFPSAPPIFVTYFVCVCVFVVLCVC